MNQLNIQEWFTIGETKKLLLYCNITQSNLFRLHFDLFKSPETIRHNDKVESRNARTTLIERVWRAHLAYKCRV